MFFADRFFGFDDATYAACRLLEIVAAREKPVSELLADVPSTFNTPEIRIDCPDHLKFPVVARVTEHFRQSHQVIDIDGARVLFRDGWGLVRASNTQPALVMRFEARSQQRLNEIRRQMTSVLAEMRKAE
jgi:phosphomannomutase/phosphoglucomutase